MGTRGFWPLPASSAARKGAGGPAAFMRKGHGADRSVLAVLSRASSERKKNPMAAFAVCRPRSASCGYPVVRLYGLGGHRTRFRDRMFCDGGDCRSQPRQRVEQKQLFEWRMMTMPRLSQRPGAGSMVALSRLIDRHQQAVRAFLARIAGNRDEAEDLAQETFLTACSQLSHYRGDASVRTWLCAIAWRKAKSARRSWFRARVARQSLCDGQSWNGPAKSARKSPWR